MGTSCRNRQRIYQSEDHPHAYGDKVSLVKLQPICSGSSPRVWGQVDNLFILHNRGRIIPTRMGTSASTAVANALEQDHPHAYGDKSVKSNASMWSKGSSPRVWGQVI